MTAAEGCMLCSDDVFVTILGALFWIFLISMTFVALAIVADEYLSPSLDVVAELTGVPHNVAAASFLAFGSAVPEIMTSVMSTVSGKVDVSLPAILGSGCIAYAVIPPCCVFCIQHWAMSPQQRRRVERKLIRRKNFAALASLNDEQPLKLLMKPLLRDVGTYIVALGLTVFFISDNLMQMWESGILVLFYVLYLASLYIWRKEWEDAEKNDDEQLPLTSEVVKSYGEMKHEEEENRSRAGSPAIHGQATTPAPGLEPADHKDDQGDGHKEEQVDDTNATGPPSTEALETAAQLESGDGSTTASDHGAGTGSGSADEVEATMCAVKAHLEEHVVDVDRRDRSASVESEGRSRAGSVEEPPPKYMIVVDYMRWPFEFLFRWTIPDVEEERWAGWWCLLSFAVSLLYVSLLSLATLSCVTQFGQQVGMEHSLSGVTLVALGAEVPDAFASMAVAKVGEGPSAVSNCLNSQIINLLIGLGLPYFLRSAVTKTDMQLGSPAGTQPFIGGLLAMLVMVFCMSTFGDMCFNDRRKPQLGLKWSYVLVVLYVLVVIAIAMWTVLT